jgi:ABC-type glycerol-3-phosphate transport system substrate-binding protein
MWCSSFVTEEDLKKEQSDWAIAKIAQSFAASHPGLSFELTMQPDQQAAHQTFKAAVMAGNAPDLADMWSGEAVFALADVVEHLNGKIPQADLDAITGWETVTLGYADGGEILAYPLRQSLCLLLYNKSIVAGVGLDLEKDPPKDADEFMAMLKKIKDAGIQPVMSSDSGVNVGYTFVFSLWWGHGSGTAGIYSNSKGITRYIDDTYFLGSLKTCYEMFDKGYLNIDYASTKQATSLFYNGESAFYTAGSWELKDASEALGDDLGIMELPPYKKDAPFANLKAIGGPGQALVLASSSKNKELALQFMSFVNNKENSIILSKHWSLFPLRNDISATDLGYAGNPLYEKQMNMLDGIMYWPDNTQVPEVMNEWYKLGALAITGKMSPEEAARQLDAKAEEIRKQQ